MSTATQLQGIAAQIADEMQEGADDLQFQLDSLETRRAQIEAELEAANSAHDRLANFAVEIGGDYQCPRCWIERETRSALQALSAGAGEDRFRCRVCREEFTL